MTYDFEPRYETVSFLEGSKVLQKTPNNLTCLVNRNGDVQVSFFGVPKIKPINKPLIADENGLKIASLVDLAGMKAAVEKAPPGVFDGRSWAYWNLKLGRYPAPPMPERRL